MPVSRYYILIILLCMTHFSYGGYIETIEVYSESMQKNIPNTVIFPNDYKKGEKYYPVLYLLHGATDQHTGWLRGVPFLVDLVDKYDMIVVCPDGNSTSWYFDSPVDSSSKYGTYINIELIEAIEQKLRVKKGEEYRGITGFSMGGHGALYAAFTYPEQWDFAASISGGVDLEPFTKNWDLPMRLGDYINHKDNWRNFSVVNIVNEPQNDPFEFLIYCGNRDFFLDVNNKLHNILQEENINHTYEILPGSHTWQFCRDVIERQFQFFESCFSQD